MADHVHHRSLADLIQTFTDFLIVSIHTILNSRALYPPSTFIMTRKYNVEVPQQRHPKVCAQIMTACSAVKTQLFEGVVRRVVFVIHQDAEVIERWIFDVDLFPVVPKDEASITMPELAVSLVDIEEQLRATMKRLAGCGAKLAPLPEDCTFTIMVELKDGADPPLGVSCFLLSVVMVRTASINIHVCVAISSMGNIRAESADWRTDDSTRYWSRSRDCEKDACQIRGGGELYT
jgi:hypothetical protein